MTSEQAVNAGLVTELMTVVIQPSDPEEPPIIPTKLSGTYKLERKIVDSKFAGYQFVVSQNYLNANSISGTFDSTEEIMKFGEEMETAGVQVNFLDDFSGGVPKYSADEATDKKLVDAVQDGLTTLQGSFEVSEGVATFKQKSFSLYPIAGSTVGAFKNINELAKMIKKFLWLDSLKPAERAESVLKDLNRGKFDYTQSFRDSLTPKPNLTERNIERSSTFWSDPEKYLTEFGDRMNRSPLSGQMQANLGVQRFKSFQPPRLRHRF